MTKYTIMLETPRRPSAGTNADVEGRILGTHDKSAWRVLDDSLVDDREQGSQDYYHLNFDDTFGDVNGLELRVKKADEDNPNWLLGTAWICKVDSKHLFSLPFNQWIDPRSYTDWVTVSLTTVQDMGIIPVPNAFGATSRFLW
jgi:hypothetical protein